MRCVRSARYNMTAEIVHAVGPDNPDIEGAGHWEQQQDDVTGEMIRVWVEDTTPDDTSDDTTVIKQWAFPCMARGYIGIGLHGGGTKEVFGENYEAIDTIRLWFGPEEPVNRDDKITNVRGADGSIIWREEEFGNIPTKFDVTGVTPIVDLYGRHVESYAICERSELQE